MSTLEETLNSLVGSSIKEDAKMQAIIAATKSGELAEDAALAQMMELMTQHPDVAALAAQALKMNPKLTAIADAHRPPRENRLPRLPPLVEAALIERAQFDGDMPEMRTGPMPRGVTPAVPVVIEGRNPVQAGMQLLQASKQMGSKIEEHEKKRFAQVDKLLSEGLSGVNDLQTALVKLNEPDVYALVQGNADTDLPEYRRGQLPAPVAITALTGSQLATLTVAEKKEAAWKLLSTTQGRRSVLPVVERLLAEDLTKRGFILVCREHHETTEQPLATHQWTVQMSGPQSTQPAFNFIDTAAKVLSSGLRSKLPETTSPWYVYLETAAINQIDERTVGWAAWLYPQGV